MTMLRVSAEQMDDGDWWAEMENCPGLWGSGPTREAAIDDCVDSFRGWLEIGEEIGSDHSAISFQWTCNV